jgi:hypothetical protein
MNVALQLFLFRVLGGICLYGALSKRVHAYWGRRGRVEFTLRQQKVLGWIWGVGFLILAFLSVLRLVSPGVVKESIWDRVLLAIVSGAACSTWVMALADPRSRKGGTRLGKFVLVINVIGAAIFGLIALANIAALLLP